MPELPIDIVIRAQNRAERDLVEVERGFGQIQRAGRLMALEITQAVNPAMTGMVASLANITRAVGPFGLALTGISVAVIGAGQAFQLFTARMDEAARRQGLLNFARMAGDVGAVRSEMEGLARDIARLDVVATQWFGRWRTGIEILTKGDPREFLEQARIAAEALMPFERRRLLGATGAAAAGARAGQIESYLGFRAAEGDRQSWLMFQKELTRAYEEEEKALRELIQAENELEMQRALARQAGPQELGVIWEAGRARLETFEEQRRALGMRRAGGRQRTELDLLLRSLPAPAEWMGVSLEGGGGEVEAAGAPGRIAAMRAETLRHEEARLMVLEKTWGLTQRERAEIQLLTIELERQAKVTEAMGDVRKESFAELEAAVQRQTIMMRELERVDPFAGMAAGLRDLTDEFMAAGQQWRDVMRRTGEDLARSFGDVFAAGLTGQLKNVTDIMRRFGMTLLSDIGTIVSRSMIGQMLGGLGFGGRMAAALPVGALPFFGTGTGAGGVGQLGLALAGAPGGGVGTTAMPGFGGIGMPSFGLGQAGLGPFSGLSAFLSAPMGAWFGGQAVVSGGQLITNAGELAMLGQTAPGLFGQGGGIGAMSFGSALGLAGGFLGLGFTIFSGLQGAPTAQNIIGGAVSGALSGALIGSIVPGIGTVIGAIGGAVLGGGAAGFGKGDAKKRKPSAAQRSAAAGQAGAQDLSRAIEAATTLDELAGLMNRQWSPHGEVQILIYPSGTPGEGPYWWAGDWDDAGNHVFTAMDLRDPKLLGGIVVQVGQTGIVPVHPQLTQQLQQKAAQLLAAETQARFGFRELLGGRAGLVGRAVERFTSLPFTNLEEGRGQRIEISRDLLLQIGLSDDEIERLLRRAQEVARERDLRFIGLEPFLFGEA